jgi:integrase
MKGGIYSDERCPVCRGRFREEHPRGLFCRQHPQCQATRCSVKFGPVFRRFRNYSDALRFLTGLRFKTDEKSFDARDYRRDQPLGFENLSQTWLDAREAEVRAGDLSREHYNNLRNYMNRATAAFGNSNIKTIGYAELEDCLKAQDKLSGKSKSNMISALHDFWTWLRKRKVITLAQFPEFPEVKYKLGYRSTISKEIQIKILEEVRRISRDVNPKIWVAIKFLCTYPSIRPKELINLQEKNIDDAGCRLYFPYAKGDDFKDVLIRRADMDLLASFPRSPFQAMPFFRHPKGVSGVHENEPFGKRYLYKWWMKACGNLGVKGIDLYGGTKHSTVRDLRRRGKSPEEIKRSTKISTNEAFDRYLGSEHDDKILEVYELTSPDTILIPIQDHFKKDKSLI